MVEAKTPKPKLLIVAKTAKEANNQIGHFKKAGFSCKATFIGATKVTNRFQAAVVVVEEGDDYDLFADTLIRFHNVPVVAFMGKVELAAEFKDSKVFGAKDYEAAAEHMKTRIVAVQADINKVFAEFDDDKNGFIERGELKKVAASLGVDLNIAELNNMVADIDLNRDGKISPEEFQLWWLSGRNGCSGSMSQILAAKLGGTPAFKTMSDTFQKLAEQAQAGVYKHKTHNIEVNFNGASVEESTEGCRISVNSSAFGESNKENVANLKARVYTEKLEEENDSGAYLYFSINLKLKEGFEDIHGACEKFNNFQMQKKLVGEKYGYIKLTFADGRLFIRGVQDAEDWMTGVNSSYFGQKTDQNINIQSMTGFNFDQLFAEDAEPVGNYVMKGMSEKIQVNLWDGFHKVIIAFAKAMSKVMTGGEEEPQGFEENGKLLEMVAPILPLFISNVNGKFDLDVKPEDLEAVMGLPQAAMAQMSVHQLLSSMSPWENLDDQELINQESDEDADVNPIWSGYKDRKDKTPVEMFNKLLGILVGMIDAINAEDGDKVGELMRENGMEETNDTYMKFGHALSMALGDNIEAEFGATKTKSFWTGEEINFNAHKKVSIQGAGLGHLVKAMLIAKMAEGGF